MPRDYADPVSGTFSLAVMIVRSHAPTARPDPIVFLPGGPGDSSMPIFASVAADPDFPLAAEQDLIVFDTRASGTSEPHVCASSGVRFLEYAAPDQSTQSMLENARGQFVKCVSDARRLQLSPAWFGTSVTIQDIDYIRRALRVERWNAVGISYGTVLGAALAARYPATLRSLVLDSVVGVGQAAKLDQHTRFERALHGLLAACEGDPNCAAKYPELESTWRSAIRRLDAKPLPISLPSYAGANSQFIMNRGDLEFLVFTGMYRNHGSVPALIVAAAKGQGDLLVPQLMRSQAQGASISLFGLLSALCRDNPRALSGAAHSAGPPDVPAGYQAIDPGTEVCSAWTKPDAPLPVPRNTSVHTLILQGELDPITPPINGIEMAMLLGPNAVFAQLPFVGHAVQVQSSCANSIVRAFLRDPTARPDLSCVAQPTPVRFE